MIPVQLAERAVFQMKQHGGGGGSWASSPVSSWQLEEAQVFWAKGEQGLALGLLRQMIHNLEEKVRHKHTDSCMRMFKNLILIMEHNLNVIMLSTETLTSDELKYVKSKSSSSNYSVCFVLFFCWPGGLKSSSGPGLH